MTNFRKLTTATAILGASALMSGAAFAEDSDMTCGDFNALDTEAQMEVAMNEGPDGGRDEAMEEARGGDDTDTEMSDSADTEVLDEAGKEGQEEMARGEDRHAAIVEHCKGGDDLMIKDARHPTADETTE